MTVASIIMIVSLLVLMILGFPIAVSLGLSSILALLVDGKISLIAFPQRLFVGIDSFPLLAVIFFLIAGELMLQGGISKRLVNLASCFLSGIRGSLALISFVTCAFFGALSGSALATTAAIGNVMYPEMLKDGSYDKKFALSIQSVGGTLGTMIPPSTPLILYGILTSASIGNLFLGTIIPGILMCLLYCGVGYIIIRKRGMATNMRKFEKGILFALKDGIWALLTPVIILGGIYTGIFSPTESAAVACLYALIIGLFVYKELNIKTLYKAMYNATLGSVSIMFLIAAAQVFGWVLTVQGLPQALTSYLVSVIQNKYTFLLLVNLIFIIAGMFMDVGTIILLVIPLLFPTAIQLGINPVHFGVIATINLSLGNVTPPFGTCLFVAAGIDKSVKLEAIYKEVIPFCLIGIVGILITTFVPFISTWMI
ncbi:TRAP transporter large permease [Marasmitruncus massiliensis]|uniref:TRAP transporter large permease n=1 Tax=Marasmitruncus massiliensis TaxID=1944642 RepID=UPI000C7A9C9C|nr:TRAP transporter large permease [Marasmitruncus massiliensis]